MTPEDRLRLKIGELVMTIAFLEATIAERDATIETLTPKPEPVVAPV